MGGSKKSQRIPRIGILSPVTESGMQDWWKALMKGLDELGYVEGRNIEFIWRFADGRFERLPSLAFELAKLEVDVIMPATPPAILAAKAATNTIAIVFPLGSDPVETGLVSSLERPGGNITGMATMSWLQSRPRMALVRELMPTARRVALIRHSANAALELQVQESRVAADELGFELLVLDFAIGEEIERAFQIASGKSVEALVPLSDPVALGNSEKIATLSMQCRIPVVSPFREITEAGGVLSYGPDLSMLFRGSARLVDQILKGAKPGDLPIEQPTKFELVINLKTAKALGLTIPQAILLRADEVIQ
jgi:putative tryptophan/tyrosine transport system substrate-binding protein